jgi:hypothetical protein
MKFDIFNLLPLFSSSQITPKLCMNCKFFTKNFFTNSDFGKCKMFPIKNVNDYFLVNGKNYTYVEYQYCTTSRSYDSMCGKEGKFYEKR